MATPVQLHLYDLTRGMASALSPMLLGKHVAGIWWVGAKPGGRAWRGRGGGGPHGLHTHGSTR